MYLKYSFMNRKTYLVFTDYTLKTAFIQVSMEKQNSFCYNYFLIKRLSVMAY